MYCMSCTVSKVHGRGLAAVSYDIRKFILRDFWSDIRKIAPTKISCYMVAFSVLYSEKFLSMSKLLSAVMGIWSLFFIL